MRWSAVGLDTPVTRSRSIEWNIVEDKAVLIHMEEGIVLKLDEVGTAIWTAIEGPSTIASLVAVVCDAYDVDSGTATKDVLRLLACLKAHEAIEYSHEKGGRDGIS